jgi:PST family polysaccharide transporter
MPKPHDDENGALVDDALEGNVAAAAAPEDEPRLGSAKLKRRVFSASAWSFLAASGGQATSFAIFALLARLLEPRDFGVVAFAALFIDLSRGVMLGGIPEALIQRKAWSDAAANTAFWLNMVAGVTFSVLAAGAVLAAAQLGVAGPAGWVFVALSATLVIDGLRAVHEARLRRNFAYKLLAARTVYATLIGGLAGVGAALLGWGVWALVVNRLVVSATQTAFIWNASAYRPSFAFERAEVRPLLSFSLQVLSARLLGQTNSRLPDFVIGSVAGPAALGLYRVGSRSLYFLTQSFLTPLQTTTLSAFSRLHDKAAVARAYRRFTQLVAALAFPVFIGSGTIAVDFVRLCFGEKWALSGPIMMILSFSVVPSVLLFAFHTALQALGRPKKALASEAIRLTAGACLVSGLALLGPLAAAYGDVARRYTSMPQALYVLKKEVGVGPTDLLKAVAVPFGCALAMAACVFTLQNTLMADATAAIRLVSSVICGGAVYALLMLTVGRRFVVDVIGSAKHGLPVRLQAAADRLLKLLEGRRKAAAVAEA